MSTIGDQYVLIGTGGSDHDRLRVVSEIHDGRTRELLLRAGFASGQRFVEFASPDTVVAHCGMHQHRPIPARRGRRLARTRHGEPDFSPYHLPGQPLRHERDH
jgi:hypothetical protein